MAGNGQTEVFTIKIDSNAAKTAKEDAAELENLRQRFESTTSSLKSHEAALRRLQQGGVVNIQTARELKAAIEAEKNALAAMTEKVVASGKSFESLNVDAKKSESEFKASTKAAGEMADAFGGGLVAAILAVEAASVLAVVALGKFILESANLARSQQLAREAVTGSEEDARRLGTQVDALALKVPLAKAALNDMAADMRLAGLSGQTLVDTLNATAQASSALGDSAGMKLREFVERGRLTQRFALSPLELQGTGLGFNDVAGALAKNTKTSLAEAQTALLQGRVTLGDGAAAIRTAVEQKFGGINLAKMLDFGVMKQKLGELFQSLTGGVDLSPLLNELKDLFSIFDQSTVAGVAMKKLVTVFGEGLVNTAAKGVPIVKGFFEEMILLSLKLYIEILKLELRFKQAFGGSDLLKNIDLFNVGVTAAKLVVIGLAALLATTAIALTPLVLLFAAVAASVAVVVYEVKRMKAIFDSLTSIGPDILQGLIGSIESIGTKGEEIANKFKAGFKKALGIASPSKVFAEFGENTAAGFGQGIERGTPDVAGSLQAMAEPRAGSGAGGGGNTINVTVNITVQGQASAHELAGDQNFLDAITKAVERGARSVGQKVAA